MNVPSAELETYRTLRLGMAAGGLLLFIALVLSIAASGWAVPPSVSATFYGPIRTIFVGTLLLVGLALVAVKGRPGWENGLLDAAGVLIPLVALVPTPVEDVACAPQVECVPPDLVQGVQLNVGAYLTLGLLALVYLWIARVVETGKGRPWDKDTTRGIVALAAVWALMAGTFLLAQPVFLQFGHYASAIPFFVILIVVVMINARFADGTRAGIDWTPPTYRRIYRGIWIVMAASVAVGVVVFAVTRRQNASLPAPMPVPATIPIIFIVEVVLLSAFIVYWALQTAELWGDTVPGTAASADEPQPAGGAPEARPTAGPADR